MSLQPFAPPFPGGTIAISPTGNGPADQGSITNAMAALAGSGGTVFLGAGTWRTTGPVVRPAGVSVIGVPGTGQQPANAPADLGTVIRPAATWAQGGAAVNAVLLHNGAQGGFANLLVDGTDLFTLPVTAHGVSGTGNDQASFTSDVLIYNNTGDGLNGGDSQGGWKISGVSCKNVGGAGVNSLPPDCDLDDVYVIGSGTHDYYLYNPVNCRLNHCRAEWAGQRGFWIDGDNTGTGGVMLTGCSTDRNTGQAVYVTAAGSWPVNITGLSCRRDGANGTSPAIEIAAAATCPVVIDGLTIFPGFNDQGGGNQGPVTGITVDAGATYVSVANALIHAVTTPVSGTLTNGRAIATRTGTWDTPSAVTRVADTA